MVDILQVNYRAANIASDLFRHARGFQEETGRGWLYFVWAGLCYIIAGAQETTKGCFAQAILFNNSQKLKENLGYIVAHFEDIERAIHDDNWLETLKAKMKKDEFKTSMLTNMIPKKVRIDKFDWILSEPKDPENKDFEDFIDLMADIYGIQLEKSRP